jgi:hypothetical protein
MQYGGFHIISSHFFMAAARRIFALGFGGRTRGYRLKSTRRVRRAPTHF